jgi:hypothetical protein
MYNDFDSATLTNCILWGNTAETGSQIYNDGTITVTYSAVEGGWSGTGNIPLNPMFADYDGRLSAASPCIDAGDNTAVFVSTDLDDNPRILDGDGDSLAKVDMARRAPMSLSFWANWSGLLRWFLRRLLNPVRQA